MTGNYHILQKKHREELPEYILADLITLAPDLRPQFPDLPLNPTLDPQYEQQRIFESVTTFLSHISAEKPLLLVVLGLTVKAILFPYLHSSFSTQKRLSVKA